MLCKGTYVRTVCFAADKAGVGWGFNSRNYFLWPSRCASISNNLDNSAPTILQPVMALQKKLQAKKMQRSSYPLTRESLKEPYLQWYLIIFLILSSKFTRGENPPFSTFTLPVSSFSHHFLPPPLPPWSKSSLKGGGGGVGEQRRRGVGLVSQRTEENLCCRGGIQRERGESGGSSKAESGSRKLEGGGG